MNDVPDSMKDVKSLSLVPQCSSQNASAPVRYTGIMKVWVFILSFNILLFNFLYEF